MFIYLQNPTSNIIFLLSIGSDGNSLIYNLLSNLGTFFSYIYISSSAKVSNSSSP